MSHLEDVFDDIAGSYVLNFIDRRALVADMAAAALFELEQPSFATVDRVARALFHERTPLAPWDEAPEWRRERYLASARVAIDAMRSE